MTEIPNKKMFADWNLVLGIYLFFVICYLEFVPNNQFNNILFTKQPLIPNNSFINSQIINLLILQILIEWPNSY